MKMKMLIKKLMKARRLGRRDSGTAMVEFALAAPVLTLLFVGMIEGAHWAGYAVMAESGAWFGATYGAFDLTTADNTANMNSYTTGAAEFLPSGYTYSVGHACSVNGAQPPTTCPSFATNPPSNTVYYVKITVTGTYTPLITLPAFSKALPQTVTVQGISYRQVATQ